MQPHTGVFPRTVNELRPHLRALREARGISQKALEQLAKRLPRCQHISSSTVSNFECALCDMSLQMFLNYVHPLGLTPLDVFPADPSTIRPQSPAHQYLHEAVDRLSQSQAAGLVPFVAQPPAGWSLTPQPGDSALQSPRMVAFEALQVGKLVHGQGPTYRIAGRDTDGRLLLHPIAVQALRELVEIAHHLPPEGAGPQDPSSAPH